MTESMLGWYDKTLGVTSVSLRYFNAAGAATDGSMGKDWNFSQKSDPSRHGGHDRKRPPLQVFGTITRRRTARRSATTSTWTSLADAHVKALDHLAEGGGR